ALERDKALLEELTRRQNEELRELNASLEQKVEARTGEVRAANDKLKQNFVTSIKVFSNLIELRGGPLSGHSRRVADLARKMALRMGLAGAEVQDVMLAGLLHDIGKIGLPDHLLAKPVSQMSGDELGVLRRHPLAGQNALMALDALGNAARLVRGHHERWDGEGYPDALREDAIPTGARILSVANDYDAMQIGSLSPRRLKPDEARDMIRQGRGKRYDPQVVDAFLYVLDHEASVGETALPPAQLKPGMVLARDLLSREGVLLLAADFVLDAGVIRQIRDFEVTEGLKLTVLVRSDRGVAVKT
ncbi:MAG: HD domain-containing protein, partial [Zoogloea sp.]|nr:HD domain-containing protein [Zoogloea sp.]